jgi:hypothetical protein
VIAQNTSNAEGLSLRSAVSVRGAGLLKQMAILFAKNARMLYWNTGIKKGKKADTALIA